MRTLLPVLRNFAFVIVLVMASLSALAAMGLQIGPLLAGAGVVGIAVGFGAQTLVRDVISGIFFLLDDAFRVGEQIESGGIRGTVESFSLRSVKMRHLNGQLHTVPFGDLKAITNYSRDWVVERLQLVVTYDTDLELLDNVVDTVNDELMADPAIAPEMIEPLRSLGVQAMIDTGMQIGLTFKTRPGRQFAVRRVIFGRIRAAFTANGIRFAYAGAQCPPGRTHQPRSERVAPAAPTAGKPIAQGQPLGTHPRQGRAGAAGSPQGHAQGTWPCHPQCGATGTDRDASSASA